MLCGVYCTCQCCITYSCSCIPDCSDYCSCCPGCCYNCCVMPCFLGHFVDLFRHRLRAYIEKT
eukprot:UN16947